MLIWRNLYKVLAKYLYISYYIFHQVIRCPGEEDLDGVLDGMVMDGLVMDGQHGQHGQDGVEETHIHSAGAFHGYQEDGGACHIGQCIAIHITCHGGGKRCHLAWDHMDG